MDQLCTKEQVEWSLFSLCECQELAVANGFSIKSKEELIKKFGLVKVLTPAFKDYFTIKELNIDERDFDKASLKRISEEAFKFGIINWSDDLKTRVKRMVRFSNRLDEYSSQELQGFNINGKIIEVPKEKVHQHPESLWSMQENFYTTNQISSTKDKDTFGNILINAPIPETSDDYFKDVESLLNWFRHEIPFEPNQEANLDYLGIDLTSNLDYYKMASLPELYMRENMYKPGYEKSNINTDPHFGLIKITEEYWNNLELGNTFDKSNILCDFGELKKANWSLIQKKLKEITEAHGLDSFFEDVVLAGGSIFSILFNQPIKDLDLFLTSENNEKAIQRSKDILKSVFKSVPRSHDNCVHLARTKNSVTLSPTNYYYGGNIKPIPYSEFSYNMKICYKESLKFLTIVNLENYTKDGLIDIFLKKFSAYFRGPALDDVRNYVDILMDEHKKISRESLFKIMDEDIKYLNFREVQVILRLYKSISEILHGFDVDSCGFGWDGKNIWATQRAIHSITKRFNVVNFERLSPSYEYRLVKYAARGIPIYVPNFSKQRVDYEKIQEKITEISKIENNSRKRDFEINKLQGLNRILYLEAIHRLNKKRAETRYNILADRFSDYRYLIPLEYNTLEFAMYFLMEDDIPGYDNKRFDKYFGEEFDSHVFPNYSINNIPKAKYIDFVSLSVLNQDIAKKSHQIIDSILNINQTVYQALEEVHPNMEESIWKIPQNTEFKTTNPGEQMTNTFHQIVLDNNNEWYSGEFYK